jgi:hypothetical protein
LTSWPEDLGLLVDAALDPVRLALPDKLKLGKTKVNELRARFAGTGRPPSVLRTGGG